MRRHYVVQVIATEEEPPKPVIVPELTRAPQINQPVDPDWEEQRRQAEVEQLFREEVLHPESITINKPRHSKVGQPQLAREDVFRRHLANPSQVSRIEKMYRRNGVDSQSFSTMTSSSSQSTDNTKHPFLGKSRNNRRRGFLIIATVIVLIFGLLTVGAAYVRADIGSTEGQVKDLLLDLQDSRLISARERLTVLTQKRKRYAAVYQQMRPVFKLLQGKDKTKHVDQLLEISDSGLHVIQTGLDSYGVLERGYKQFMGQEEGKSTQTFSQVSGDLEILFTELSSLQAKTQLLGNPYHLAIIDQLKNNLNSRVPRLRKYFLSAQQLSYVLPEILGENGQKKQYLVLLQNNAELRPTGGFIGSLAIITVENGKFIDFRVEDVYEADGQLNGYVAPPPEITQFLGEAQWFLRDVNWSPDFPTVAKQASWFLNKEISINPDGVIAINLEVIKKLLAVTGPVKLVDYDNEVITQDNLYERAQQHAELNFFPGSTQKSDFLSAVASALYDRLTRDDTNKMLILKSLLQSAEESELLASLPQAEEALHNLGWDGSVRTPECPYLFSGKVCFVDTVMQVEANVGVNKANQFIKRTVQHEAKINESTVAHERTITLENTADSNAWPEGAYKSYLRLLVTRGAQLDALTINDTPIDLRGVVVKEENNKTSFGFLVQVPIKTTYVIKMAYHVPIPGPKPTVYALFEQKQPGSGADSLLTRITAENREIVTVAPEPEIEGHTLKFATNHLTHQFFAVEMR